MKVIASLLCVTILGTAFAHAQDAWKAVEQVKAYAITGKTGFALYESIGQRGPKIGKTQVIAHTSYVLTWDRKFDHSNKACTILSAKPKLKITYTLPKPAESLPPEVRANWDVFIEGIRKHEQVHGQSAIDMTREIVRRTVGLSVPNDPKCQKVRRILINEINGLVEVQRQHGRDFDRVEMGQGGNVQQLVLALVNGS
ncbi:DUF922 domain-containing protein [Brucella sp. BE17]|uniref:DUF922 domain-containing Zn-dependent protease n=1 Tax=Brucella sp. BE17 TaxID=3142977 RepID=UPI0031BBB4FE